MKQYILYLAVLFMLAGCQEHKSNKQKRDSKDGITQLSAEEKNDTIFLGLHFGMSEEAVYNYFYDLESKGRLHLMPHKYLSDNRNIFTYNFDFAEEAPSLQNVHATFRSFYIQDKLYKLRITVESDQEANLQLLKTKLFEDYILKYGHNYTKQENTLNNSDGFIWVDNDKMIEICEGYNNNVLIIYTDVKALKENEETPKQIIMREI